MSMLETETSTDGIPPLVATAVAMNTAVAGNFDLDIHCVPRPANQTVEKASDGGANETKEHWVYDVTIENKTFKISLILTLST